jgi:two-component system, OmpR family, sensor histidine kinase MprB
MRWRRRPLMLRTRFSIAVAAAVAVATLAITAVTFVVVRGDLEGQVRTALVTQATDVNQLARRYHGHIPTGWVPRSDQFGSAVPYMQIVTDQGAVWAPAGDSTLLAATTGAVQVAAGRSGSYYADAKVAGVRVTILTTELAPGLALQLVAPLASVDADVADVGATMALLSVLGIALAALAGRAVAGAGLAPVGRLAAAAEQVTATGYPDTQVEVGRPDELGRLATSFNTMLSALQRSLAAQRQLVSDASHELRTPLTSMRINVELLASSPDMPVEERQEVLDRVVAQGAELSQLVTSITELARGEPAVTECEVVPLHEVVATELAAARRDWPETAFPVELEPWITAGSTERIGHAVRNLLDNAAKYSPPGAVVEVRLADGELTVRDHGSGIEPTDLPHIFDRFYRAPSARGVPGSGLGLAIVRQVADSHGGSVRAESVPGGGTLMRLRLPAGYNSP